MPTTSETPAIRATDLGKVYRIGELADMMRRGRELYGRLRGIESDPHQDFPALNKVSFEVPVGECLGIMGSNGSGKSTLVQII